jgi:hypothetical protein
MLVTESALALSSQWICLGVGNPQNHCVSTKGSHQGSATVRKHYLRVQLLRDKLRFFNLGVNSGFCMLLSCIKSGLSVGDRMGFKCASVNNLPLGL